MSRLSAGENSSEDAYPCDRRNRQGRAERTRFEPRDRAAAEVLSEGQAEGHQQGAIPVKRPALDDWPATEPAPPESLERLYAEQGAVKPQEDAPP